MIKVGVCGLGMMGSTHLDIYQNHPDVKVVAVADADEKRLSGEEAAVGNIEGQAQGKFDLTQVEQFRDAADLISLADVDVVDICLPTQAHQKFVLQAVAAGKHVLVEKPLARNLEEANALVLALKSSPQIVMPAMCMRFWPGWDWLKATIDQKTYGKVLGATFRRVVSHPGGAFYSDGDQCGGALLDLHIHDTDFIHYCFGMPEAVTSCGYSKVTSQIDHVLTQYHYRDVPLVAAEGSWCMSPGFEFNMSYSVNFERATAQFDLAQEAPLILLAEGQEPQSIPLAEAMGYELEISYFLDCIRNNTKPTIATPQSAAHALQIFEAERKSIESKRRVACRPENQDDIAL